MKFVKTLLFSFMMSQMLLLNAYAQKQCEEQPRYFSISGTAEVRVKPDRVTMVVGMMERSTDLSASKNKMAEVMKAIIAYSKQKGVEEKYIQTSHIAISPNYRYDNSDRLKLVYYEVNQSLSITLEDVDLYDQFIYDLLDMGVNTVSDIQFSSTEMRKYRDQARLQAVAAAKEKAQLLANAAGVKLGPVVNVTEDNFVSPAYRMGAMGINAVQNISFQSHDSGEGDSGAAAGVMPIRATVTLTYRLLD